MSNQSKDSFVNSVLLTVSSFNSSFSSSISSSCSNFSNNNDNFDISSISSTGISGHDGVVYVNNNDIDQKLKVIFSNIDSLSNKHSELLAFLAIKKPHVIGLCEVFPKNIPWIKLVYLTFHLADTTKE